MTFINKMSIKKLIVFSLVAACATGTVGQKNRDWANFGRYEADNKRVVALPADCRQVVFMGNSITDFWPRDNRGFFEENGFVGRGIAGQTSYQMLSRFFADVVALHPRAVVINAGTNDIAQNTHPYDPDRTFDNILAMAQLAQANGIVPVLSDILPCDRFYWDTTVTCVPQKIAALNSRLRDCAGQNGWQYIRYHDVMVARDGRALAPDLTKDGVHPNAAGYGVMQSAALPAIRRALVQSAK